MLHELMGRIAAAGGEIALTAICLASIVGCAIIADRLWCLFARAEDPAELNNQLQPYLDEHDWANAAAIVQATPTTIAVAAHAVLSHAGSSIDAARAQLRSAIAQQRLMLEHHLSLLRGLAVVAILAGLAGSACDYRALARFEQAGTAITAPQQYYFGLVLAPITGGLVAAIPLWLASTLLGEKVRRTLLQSESLAEQLLASIIAATVLAQRPPSSVKSTPFAAVA